MFVIDVNSGGRKKGATSQEENALITNWNVLMRLQDSWLRDIEESLQHYRSGQEGEQ